MNSEFSFYLTSCLTKAKEPIQSYDLPIAGGRIIGFIPFPRLLVLCEMQSVSSRIWTHVAVSSSYDDNHYTMGTSTCVWDTKKYFISLIVVLNLSRLNISYKKCNWKGPRIKSTCEIWPSQACHPDDHKRFSNFLIVFSLSCLDSFWLSFSYDKREAQNFFLSLVCFYVISTIVSYFKAKSGLYLYIRYISFVPKNSI